MKDPHSPRTQLPVNYAQLTILALVTTRSPVRAFCCSAEVWEGILAVRGRREGWRVDEKGRGLAGEKGEELTSCMEKRAELSQAN